MDHLPTFSQEIFDRIIELGQGDLKLLATCALVCKNWVPASRRNLFQEITISCDTINRDKWDDIQLSTQVAHYARQLRLDGSGPTVSGAHPIHYFLPFIASWNPAAIRSLWLDTVDMHPRFPTPHFFSRDITDLRLTCFVLYSYHSLFAFISALSALTTLTMDPASDARSDYRLEDHDDGSPVPPTSLTTLRLDLNEEDMEAVMIWFLTTPSPSLTDVSLVRLLPQNYVTARRLLSSIAGDLVDLSISLFPTPLEGAIFISDDLEALLDMSPYKQLRSLRLRMQHWGFWSAPWLLDCLSSLHRDMKCITLSLSRKLCRRIVKRKGRKPAPNWHQLSSILSLCRFPRLQQVRFVPRESVEQVGEFIREHYSGCNLRDASLLVVSGQD
ncbi:hypothetical protein C8J56DRAFT_288389 [Mycena floridula]|nr:hypothetical protein C8J56DRAFT_288389 [Mycena floridula]